MAGVTREEERRRREQGLLLWSLQALMNILYFHASPELTSSGVGKLVLPPSHGRPRHVCSDLPRGHLDPASRLPTLFQSLFFSGGCWPTLEERPSLFFLNFLLVFFSERGLFSSPLPLGLRLGPKTGYRAGDA